MVFVRLYTGHDGQTHFEDIDPKFAPDPINMPSKILPGAEVRIYSDKPNPQGDWHVSGRRQYLIILQGLADIGIGDGTHRVFVTGDVLLFEDTTGKGHTTGNPGSVPRVTLGISLA